LRIFSGQQTIAFTLLFISQMASLTAATAKFFASKLRAGADDISVFLRHTYGLASVLNRHAIGSPMSDPPHHGTFMIHSH